MPRKTRNQFSTRIRLAAVLVFLVAAAAITVLVACPPARRVGAPAVTVAPVTPPTVAPATPMSSGAPAENATGQTAQERPAPRSTGTGMAPPARSVEPVPAAPRGQAGAPPEHPRPERQGMVAMIIDDAGYSLDELQEFLDLPGPLTIAVLPNLPHSREAAARVLAAGKDLILHCPMQPVGRENPGPGALYVGQSADRVAALLDAAFASVPGAIGMNNHMGSAATADPALMTDVLEYLKEKNLFYIDSRTTADTVGPRIARELGVPFTQRDVFIDDDPVETKVGVAFDAGIVAARSTGSVVMIGHVQNRSVAAILRSRNAALEGLGLKWASLRDVMRDRERKDLPVEDTRDRKLLR